jgi:hypothetical protein
MVTWTKNLGGESVVLLKISLIALASFACKKSIGDSGFSATESIEEAPQDLLGRLPEWSQDPWDYQKLSTTIRSQNLRSVEAVLAVLPKWLQASYTLIHTSADGEEVTDYANPRVLLFSPDGKFILSYNIKSDVHRLRIAQFIDRQERLALYEINFDPAGSKAANFSQENPSDCSGCHNDDPKYHIEEYDKWQGWYGSLDDSFLDGSAEDKGLQDLRRRAKAKEPRLEHLAFPEQFPNYPYHRFDPAMQKNSVGRGFSSMPNTRLTLAMMRLQARIAFRKLKSSPNYELAAPLLAYVMLEPKADVIQFRSQVTQTCDSTLSTSTDKKDHGPDLQAAVRGLNARYAFDGSADRYQVISSVLNAAGVDPDEYLNPAGSIHDLTSRARSKKSHTFMDGFFGIRDVLLDLIWRDLSANIASLSQYYDPLNMTSGVEFAVVHWGNQARYNRDYHFRDPQRRVFDNIATAMISPKGDSFKAACQALSAEIGRQLGTADAKATRPKAEASAAPASDAQARASKPIDPTNASSQSPPAVAPGVLTDSP